MHNARSNVASSGAETVVQEALQFFVRPRPIRPESGNWRAEGRPLLTLLALNLGVLFLILPLLIAWTRAAGIEPPRMMHDIPEAMVLLLAVAILPPLEELAFRGWMTGRPRALFALGVAVLAALVLVRLQGTGPGWLAPAITLAAAVVAAAGAVALRRKDDAPLWFSRNFKWFFWGSTILFASAHYSNYPAMSIAHLPLVLPQFWSGLVFGFTRLRFGLLRSILLHCASNAMVLAAFLLFGIPTV